MRVYNIKIDNKENTFLEYFISSNLLHGFIIRLIGESNEF